MLFEDQLIFFPAKYPEGAWHFKQVIHGDGQIVPKIENCQLHGCCGGDDVELELVRLIGSRGGHLE